MALTSMKLSPAEQKNNDTYLCPAPCEDNGPIYPYGLMIRLCDETLDKLGMTELPAVGTKMVLHALVEITEASQRKTQEGKEIRAELQITDMELLESKKPSGASLLYPNSVMA